MFIYKVLTPNWSAAPAPSRPSDHLPASSASHLPLPDPQRPIHLSMPGSSREPCPASPSSDLSHAPYSHVARTSAPAPARSDVPWNLPSRGDQPAETCWPRLPPCERPSVLPWRPADPVLGEEGAASRRASGPSVRWLARVPADGGQVTGALHKGALGPGLCR